ncbi:MAG: hypothetical protein ABR514_11470, partial [Chthoniobacterales bacterium]
MKSGRSLLLIALLVLTPRLAFAHHGKDFLLVESYDVPEPGDFYLFLQPGFSLSMVIRRSSWSPPCSSASCRDSPFELHAHIDKEAENSLQYEATAPSLHFQVTPPDSCFPVQVGV